MFHARLEAGTAKKGFGKEQNSHPFALGSINDCYISWSTSEQAQVLLRRQTLPQIQTPTVCSTNQPTHYWWNGDQRKQTA